MSRSDSVEFVIRRKIAEIESWPPTTGKSRRRKFDWRHRSPPPSCPPKRLGDGRRRSAATPIASGLGGMIRVAILLLLAGGQAGPRPAHAGTTEPPKSGSIRLPRLQSLDGRWEIARDANDTGRTGRWYDPTAFPADSARAIEVPGNINEAWPNPAPVLSPAAANLVWYRRTFTPEIAGAPNLRDYLRFGAVSYLSEVWLNGTDLGLHEGGQDPFEFDVTDLLRPGEPNTLVVRVSSHYFGGINQYVALAAQPAVRIIDGFARPDTQAGVIRLDVTLENNTSNPAPVGITASFGEYKPQRALGSKSAAVTAPPGRSAATLILPVSSPRLWSLDDPFLYTVKIVSQWRTAPSEEAGRDDYSLRTGFRDFRITDGYFYLNGRRILLKSTHGNWYDPIVIQATPRTMNYLRRDMPELEAGGVQYPALDHFRGSARTTGRSR